MSNQRSSHNAGVSFVKSVADSSSDPPCHLQIGGTLSHWNVMG